MARSNLRCATIQLVHRSPRHLSWRFRRRIFPIDVCHAAIGSGRLSEQHRVVRADAFPFWPWNFSADAAHRALSDVWRHIDRRAFLHGPRLAAPGFLERGWPRSSSLARRDFSIARRRRLALLGRYWLE